MKNIIKKLMVAFLGALSIVSCGDDFINEAKPTNGVPVSTAFDTRESANGVLSGIMRRFRGQFTSTDAAGVNSLFFARTVKGNDVISDANWYQFDYENDNREPTYRRTNFSWTYPYFMINQINTLIKGVTESTKLSETDKNELLGQGYALRAFFYHQLVLEFSKSYKLDPNFPAPPIYKDPTATPAAMSTVKEMYDFIVDDLTKAVSLCSTSRLGKSYVNKQVANAILAEVYQVMGQWNLAETAAIAAYGGNPASVLDASTYAAGFKDYTNREWLWGSPQSDDQSSFFWLAPHAFSDHRSNGYSSIYVNSDFVNMFSATDIRGGVGAGRLFNLKNPSYAPTDYRYYVSNKFSFSFSSHSPIIRYPEMILIEAEAKARQGNEAGAKAVLYALQKNRDANAVQSATTGQALIDEILVERRKELFMENGVEWFDAKRLGTPMVRTGNHRLKGVNNVTGNPFYLQANDNRFFLKIPQAEIDANPNIDDTVNAGR
ncbi:RagB/SusD family nutrient uptake outer membrane protein [Flavobacterium sp. RSSA_27]|uniref:RagB/SusD family nutrient uptake outer membrane protein n=1 Tax=Flavobacterium sp. RSSA_27 TaxID=3447667 RepID=UPI003F38E939